MTTEFEQRQTVEIGMEMARLSRNQSQSACILEERCGSARSLPGRRRRLCDVGRPGCGGGKGWPSTCCLNGPSAEGARSSQCGLRSVAAFRPRYSVGARKQKTSWETSLGTSYNFTVWKQALRDSNVLADVRLRGPTAVRSLGRINRWAG